MRNKLISIVILSSILSVGSVYGQEDPMKLTASPKRNVPQTVEGYQHVESYKSVQEPVVGMGMIDGQDASTEAVDTVTMQVISAIIQKGVDIEASRTPEVREESRSSGDENKSKTL